MEITKKVTRPSGTVRPVIRKLVDGEMVEVRTYEPFSNVITNSTMVQLYTALGTQSIFKRDMTYWKYLRVGTGTAPYTADTLEMGNRFDSVYAEPDDDVIWSLGEVEENGKYYILCQIAWPFQLGELNGTYTEMATFRSTSLSYASYPVMTGTLFKDSNDDPVSITVTDEEQLVIYYDFRVEITQDDYNAVQGQSSYVDLNTELADMVVNVNGTDHTVSSTVRKYRYYRIAGDDTHNNNRTLSLLSTTSSHGNYQKGVAYSVSNTTGVQLSAGSTNGEVSGTVTVAPDNMSVTYNAEVTVAPAATLSDINKIGCINYSNNLSILTLEFDPTIPIPSGDKFILNVSLTVDWSDS